MTAGMYRILLLCFLSLDACLINSRLQEAGKVARRHKKNAQKYEENEKMADFYVLAMSYQPEFCYSHRTQSFAGCAKPQQFWKSELTLHGLWPQFSDGSWPSTCSNEPFNVSVVREIGFDRFEKYWPNVKSSPHDLEVYAEFWQHEWSKHGTCSGLAQDVYFREALDSFLQTPKIVGDHYGDSSGISKETLIYAYGGPGKVVTVCSGHSKEGRYLTEVRACLKRGEDGKLLGRISCPDSVLAEDSCGDTIVVAAFYSDRSEDERGVVHERID